MVSLSHLGLDKIKGKSYTGDKLNAAVSAGLAWLYCDRFLGDSPVIGGEERRDLLESDCMRLFCAKAAIAAFRLRPGDSTRDIPEKILSLDPALRADLLSDDMMIRTPGGDSRLYGFFEDFEGIFARGLPALHYGCIYSALSSKGLVGGEGNEDPATLGLKRRCMRFIAMMSVLGIETGDGDIVIRSDPSVCVSSWYGGYWKYPGYTVYIGSGDRPADRLPRTRSITLGNLGMVSSSAAFFYSADRNKTVELVDSIMSVSDAVLSDPRNELSEVTEEMRSLSGEGTETMSGKERRKRKYELEARAEVLRDRIKGLEKTLSLTRLCISPGANTAVAQYFPEFGSPLVRTYSVSDFDMINTASMDTDTYSNMVSTSEALRMPEDGSPASETDRLAHGDLERFEEEAGGAVR